MKKNTGYQTKNKKRILDFVSTQKDVHFSANDVYRHFINNEHPISIPTIYRQLDNLTDENILQKYRNAELDSTLYYYIGEISLLPEQSLMKCTSCQKTFPLQCHAAEELTEHIEDKHQFFVHMNETVFYGTCGSCVHL